MQIQIISVGKLKEKIFNAGIAEYAKRLAPYAKLTLVEVADEKAPEQLSASEERQVKAKEGERILSHIKQDTYVVAWRMAIEGEMWTSEQLAEAYRGAWYVWKSESLLSLAVAWGSLNLSHAPR